HGTPHEAPPLAGGTPEPSLKALPTGRYPDALTVRGRRLPSLVAASNADDVWGPTAHDDVVAHFVDLDIPN
ncbi:MAG: hypothetical protein ACRD2X_12465, partial [Vicinamibacteraceae bacterium]